MPGWRSSCRLAGRLRTATVATFDERHFRAVRPLAVAGAFTLMPLDLPAEPRAR